MKHLVDTEKASIYITPSSDVIKRFKCAHRAARERDAMIALERVFSDVDEGGWSYRAVRFIDQPSEFEIRMSFASGRSVDQHLNGDVRVFYQVGRWLGVFHRQSLTNKVNVVRYVDCNRHNIIVDSERRIVTAIDPGDRFGSTGVWLTDLTVAAWSICVGALRSGVMPVRSISELSWGYASTRKVELSWAVVPIGIKEAYLSLSRPRRGGVLGQMVVRPLCGIGIGLIAIYISALLAWSRDRVT